MLRPAATTLLALLLAAPLAAGQVGYERAGERPRDSRERERYERYERHERAEFLEVLSPVGGTTFEAGGLVELHWAPGPDLAAFEKAREWEAFLSLDGGKTWAFRITPHADLARRQMSFRVPEIPADDVRLLLRVGDEVEEREQQLGGRYRIVASRAAVAPSAARLAPHRGESARPGELGVLSWVEELADGRLVEYRAAPGGPVLTSPEPARLPALVATLDSQRERERDSWAGMPSPSPYSPQVVASVPLALRPARSLPILLLVQRLNE